MAALALAGGWDLPAVGAGEMRSHAFRTALRMGLSVDLADDIAQATVIRLNDAVEASPALKHSLDGESWPLRVERATRQVVIGFRRAERRRHAAEVEAAVSVCELVDETQELEAILVTHVIESAAAELTKDEQLFVHFRYYEGLRLDDIAEVMDLDLADVRAIGRRANQRLASLLRS